MRATSHTPPRKDQVRNRHALVIAAQEVFAELGPDINLDQVARRAGVASSTLFRHFATKDDLVETVLDAMVRPVLVATQGVGAIRDPWDAFCTMFTECCTLTESEVVTFARLAALNDRTLAYAHRLLVSVVEPATSRLQAAGGLRGDLTVDDVAVFARMVEGAYSSAQRHKALEVLLAGIRATSPHAWRDAPRSTSHTPSS